MHIAINASAATNSFLDVSLNGHFFVSIFIFCKTRFFVNLPMKKFLVPKFINKYTDVYRSNGIKGVVKVGGWRVVVAFFLFYLIRDSIIYLIIPFLAARGCGLV